MCQRWHRLACFGANNSIFSTESLCYTDLLKRRCSDQFCNCFFHLHGRQFYYTFVNKNNFKITLLMDMEISISFYDKSVQNTRLYCETANMIQKICGTFFINKKCKAWQEVIYLCNISIILSATSKNTHKICKQFFIIENCFSFPKNTQ